MAADRPEVHLRVLVSDDAEWIVEVDRATASALARGYGWDVEKLAAELDEGVWASDDRWGWAIVVDGTPGGFTLVTGLDGEDARMSIRIAPQLRGKGVGREVLRQLADHHFQANPHLLRLHGRAHEHNVPMQRAFNAAGFRMEARYRDSYRATPDGPAANEWGYALTRGDWEGGRHRLAGRGYDLHGLWFEVDQTIEGPRGHGLEFKFLQEGRRAIARYHAHRMTDGELAGILVDDVFRYRFVHTEERHTGGVEVVGRGRARLQRRGDGRLEVVDEWSDDTGAHGRRVLVERRDT
ncbi:GNAT family N-acetyltransferase [Egicoccus sp. AB-alg6-2]|uniref:GNAT family N-acetyltransferase n=1 Tax=Egicoccus sp. AB-alg6-2 TaxID=3242692 RepID=UPI00359D6C16